MCRSGSSSSKDDKACEAAVNFVGGADFFNLSDKNKTMITKIILKGRNRRDQVVILDLLEFEQGEVAGRGKGRMKDKAGCQTKPTS